MRTISAAKKLCIITTILPFRVCIICEIIRKGGFHSLTLMDMEGCLFVREDYKNTSKRQNPKVFFNGQPLANGAGGDFDNGIPNVA
jgi:hypothetical protein